MQREDYNFFLESSPCAPYPRARPFKDGFQWYNASDSSGYNPRKSIIAPSLTTFVSKGCVERGDL